MKNKIVIVVSKFNKLITDELLAGVLEELNNQSVNEKNVQTIEVPGALEIPGTIKMIIKYSKPLAVIALGAVIKGETAHFEFVAENSSRLISDLSIQNEIPIINGILTTYDSSQAVKRSSRAEKNKGAEFAKAAMDMLHTYGKIKRTG